MDPKRCARHHRSPPTRGHPWRIESRATFRRRYRCQKGPFSETSRTRYRRHEATLWEFSEHVAVAARATPLGALRTRYRRRKGRVVHDVSPNAKKWQKFAVVNGRLA